MFNTIRYRIAYYCLKKAQKEIDKGGFKSIKRGIKYFKYSLSIVPPSKELFEFGIKMRDTLHALNTEENDKES